MICFLAGSSLAQFIFAQLQPVLSFLGERVHVLEPLGDAKHMQALLADVLEVTDALGLGPLDCSFGFALLGLVLHTHRGAPRLALRAL